MSRWTLQGRVLHFDGKPFVYIDKEEGTRPVEADGAARLIVDLFNRQGVTPDSIYEKHMGRSRRAPQIREKDDWRKYSMTYGVLPPFEKFEKDIRRPNPDNSDGSAYWPEGSDYPMELVSDREIQAAEDFGQLESFRTSRPGYAFGFRGNEQQIYDFIKFLMDQEDAYGDEEDSPGGLASSIMYTLGYEWI